ncbi:hypothetical protein [Alkalihalobacillus sp. AL-G]|uniref:hypothetical protein n=1 Tax=Alkalihalobacillus sp. AL-G TaxID=2926399 RepID=UPI00272CA13C|nr:hypothetical protein [Alkalihalobacillus sp. AL-G]WLD94181.1 hypothetical protein MOJ78_04625 [Alkalihalobacillus sp. AL-G]
MSGESLPALFWIIHYLFLAVTLGTTIFSLIKKEMVIFSMVTSLTAIIVPFIGLINSISRMVGTEYDYIKEIFIAWGVIDNPSDIGICIYTFLVGQVD